MTEPNTTSQGRILAGRYTLGEFVGQGGMATVYRGTDTKLGRQVAIKVMKADLAGDEAFRERFRQEAQSAARMAHPTIVRVLDAGDDLIQTAAGPKQLPFIVMEYVDGKNLRQHLLEGRLSAEEACRVVDAVLTALEYSHRAGIVHRDIKPANIMITSTGRVKVMDFGIARAVSETSSTLQQTTAILGTAAYFSPEQAKGETVDARSDLYSTGVMLYEMLTGDVPFRGDTAVAVAYQHVSERPVRPSERDSAVSPALDRVVMHSMAKDRAKRFQTAGEFREALKVAASGQMPVLSDSGADETVLFSGGEEVSESTLALRQLAEGGSSKSQSRPPVMWTWASILTVAAVIAAVVFWLVNLAPTEFNTSSRVPDLTGVPRAEAIQQLEEVDLVAITIEETDPEVEEGSVIRTDPPAGSTLSKDSNVTLYVSSGPEDTEIPNVVGDTLEQAEKKLGEVGLTIGSIATSDDASAEKDTVLKMTPEPGSKVKASTTIDVTVSSGQVSVPDVTGQSLQAARALLDSEGLQVNAVPRDCEITGGALPIVEQSLVGSQPQRSEIDIVYCTGSNDSGGDDSNNDDDDNNDS